MQRDAGEAVVAVDASAADAGERSGSTDAALDSGPAAPPRCGDAVARPTDGLRLWLDGRGGLSGDGAALRWTDTVDGARAARVGAGAPVVRRGFFAGIDGVGFDGDDDRLEVDLSLDGATSMTLVMVSSSSGRAPGVEWCCRDDETGCSGTYHTALMWLGARDWGGVYIGPSQREVSVRFGNGHKSYTEGDFYDTQVFGAEGYGSCRADPARDPFVAYTRPTDLGVRATETIAVLRDGDWSLHVDGRAVWSRGPPGGARTGVDAPGPLRLGEGAYGRNWEGVIGLVAIYDRALEEDELAALHHEVGCSFTGTER